MTDKPYKIYDNDLDILAEFHSADIAEAYFTGRDDAIILLHDPEGFTKVNKSNLHPEQDPTLEYTQADLDEAYSDDQDNANTDDAYNEGRSDGYADGSDDGYPRGYYDAIKAITKHWNELLVTNDADEFEDYLTNLEPPTCA